MNARYAVAACLFFAGCASSEDTTATHLIISGLFISTPEVIIDGHVVHPAKTTANAFIGRAGEKEWLVPATGVDVDLRLHSNEDNVQSTISLDMTEVPGRGDGFYSVDVADSPSLVYVAGRRAIFVAGSDRSEVILPEQLDPSEVTITDETIT